MATGAGKPASTREGDRYPFGVTDAPAVIVDGVTKDFRIPRERVHTLKERALHPFRRATVDTMHGLRGISFDVAHGEFFGIVGRNGSGKSTLLKCLAGIYATDKGEIYVNGRLSTFIELGVGFNPDLAAYDNVMINAAMLGLSGREAKRRYDRIIDFAELHEFTELKIKNYSSGMLVRLAFSVMIQVDADILLIDEVLAVGDAAFQQKCFDEFGRIRRSGATVVLVTHDMSAVRRFCDRAMLLEAGRMVEIGDPDRIGQRYLDLNFSESARAEHLRGPLRARARAPSPSRSPRRRRATRHRARARAAPARRRVGRGPRALGPRRRREAGRLRPERVGRDRGDAGAVPRCGRGPLVRRARRGRPRPAGRRHEQPQRASGRPLRGRRRRRRRVPFPAVMAQGRHWLTATVAHAGTGEHVMDRRERIASIVVHVDIPTIGIASTPFTVRVERATERVP